MRKVIITAALTGGGLTKKDNPNLPEQPDEIIEQALQCREAGAAIVHIHARDKMSRSTDAIPVALDVFREIHNGIKKSSDLIVELSTGGGPMLTMEERISPLSLKPDIIHLQVY